MVKRNQLKRQEIAEGPFFLWCSQVSRAQNESVVLEISAASPGRDQARLHCPKLTTCMTKSVVFMEKRGIHGEKKASSRRKVFVLV